MGRGSDRRTVERLEKELEMAYRKIKQLEKASRKLANYLDCPDTSSEEYQEIIEIDQKKPENSKKSKRKAGDCPKCFMQDSVESVDIGLRVLLSCKECDYRKAIKNGKSDENSKKRNS